MKIYFLLVIFIVLWSCSGKKGYEQKYSNYLEYNSVNWRNKCWFPDSLLMNDAHSIKNKSYLNNKCLFGTFSYLDDKNYDSIFESGLKLDSVYYGVFIFQLQSSKNIVPKWFSGVKDLSDYRDIIVIDKCYAWRNKINRKIYFFHPKEDDTILANGKRFPGIRNTIR